MLTLMKIWIANREFFKEEEFITAFKKIEQNARIRQDSVMGGVGIKLEEMCRQVYRTINYKKSSNKFIQFWNEEILIPKD